MFVTSSCAGSTAPAPPRSHSYHLLSEVANFGTDVTLVRHVCASQHPLGVHAMGCCLYSAGKRHKDVGPDVHEWRQGRRVRIAVLYKTMHPPPLGGGGIHGERFAVLPCTSCKITGPASGTAFCDVALCMCVIRSAVWGGGGGATSPPLGPCANAALQLLTPRLPPVAQPCGDGTCHNATNSHHLTVTTTCKNVSSKACPTVIKGRINRGNAKHLTIITLEQYQLGADWMVLITWPLHPVPNSFACPLVGVGFLCPAVRCFRV